VRGVVIAILVLSSVGCRELAPYGATLAVDARIAPPPLPDAGSPVPWCSAEEWCLSYPTQTHFQELHAIWRSPRGTLYVTGDKGTLLRREGDCSWERLALQTTVALYGVWGSADDDVYVVGAAGTVLHYDGKSWTPVEIPEANALRGVWGSGPGDVYLVGDNATLLHYDGQAWHPVALPAEVPLEKANGIAGFRAVWGSGARDVVVVGEQGLALRYDGGKWRLLASGGTTLHAVWGRGADAVYMSGDRGTLLRCDNTLCAPIHTGVSQSLKAIGGIGDDEMLVLGAYGTALRCGADACEHETADSYYDLQGLTTTGSEPIAVGAAAHILRYADNHWTKFAGGQWAVGKVWALDSANVYAIVRPFFPYEVITQLVHFDGTHWRELLVYRGPGLLQGVWAHAADDVFVVGSGGLVMHYDGARWSTMESGVEISLLTVWGAGPDDVYAAGAQGTTLHYDGQAWSTMPTPLEGTQINALWGADAEHVFAVGNLGTVVALQADGTWMRVTAGGGHLRAIWGSSANDVYAIGDTGTMLHYDGLAWAPKFTGIDGNLLGIWGSDPHNVYVSGSRGLLHYTSTSQSWIDVPTGPGFHKPIALTGAKDASGLVTLFAAGMYSIRESATIIMGVMR